MFPPKPDRHTYRRTDISVFRVASLLNRYEWFKINFSYSGKDERFPTLQARSNSNQKAMTKS